VLRTVPRSRKARIVFNLEIFQSRVLRQWQSIGFCWLAVFYLPEDPPLTEPMPHRGQAATRAYRFSR
jgi:hypothetical protein